MQLAEKFYINGQWVTAKSGETFEIKNPANGQLIGKLPNMGKEETDDAIDAAAEAFKNWSKTTGKERAQILRKFYELLKRDRDKLAKILTTEQGKSLSEAYAEIDYGTTFPEWFAEEAKRIYGEVVPAIKSNQRLFTIKQPIGVVAAITPWNFPLAMITRKISPALAAGCTVVLKPSEETPYSALACMKLLEEAGLPNGVVNIIAGKTAEIGDALTASKTVRLLAFTGSTKVGKMLMEKCSGTVKKVALELGGNSPFIIFEDANLDKAVAALVASKLRSGGQSCTGANRIYIHASIADEVLKRTKKEFEKIKIGNGLDDGVQLGPLINDAAVNKIDGLIADALANGSIEIYAADVSEHKKQSSCFYAPKIIKNEKQGLKIEQTEIFGPVVSAFTFKDEEEVIKRANDTDYGLASYIFTENKDRIWRVSEALEYGMVGINDMALASEMCCFGGVKQSGIGREGGRQGIEEFLEEKYLVLSIAK
jgi:succinate-semialdehyde dehydrogenase/glutarate-semialdehyde dehydrogenase